MEEVRGSLGKVNIQWPLSEMGSALSSPVPAACQRETATSQLSHKIPINKVVFHYMHMLHMFKSTPGTIGSSCA